MAQNFGLFLRVPGADLLFSTGYLALVLKLSFVFFAPFSPPGQSPSYPFGCCHRREHLPRRVAGGRVLPLCRERNGGLLTGWHLLLSSISLGYHILWRLSRASAASSGRALPPTAPAGGTILSAPDGPQELYPRSANGTGINPPASPRRRAGTIPQAARAAMSTVKIGRFSAR